MNKESNAERFPAATTSASPTRVCGTAASCPVVVAGSAAALLQLTAEFWAASGVVTGAGQPLPANSGIANGAPDIVASRAP